MYVTILGSSCPFCQLSLEICNLLPCTVSKLFFRYWECIVHIRT